MLSVRMVRPSEMDLAKNLIRSIFPDAMIQLADYDTLLIAEEQGRAVGFAHIVDEGDRILLQGMGVDKSSRGMGVGTILLQSVFELLGASELPIYLKVKAMNPAIDLYARYGFVLKKFGEVHVLVKRVDN